MKPIDEEEALVRATKYGFEEEVKACLENGMSPIESLIEWDIF